ncbi:MAG: HIT family protein [Pseudomonadota bacterium]
MSLKTAYDADNIFAKIIRGEAPAVKVCESKDVLAFMDVFPQSEGHCLVVHKRQKAVNLFDIDGKALATLTKVVQEVAAAIVKALEPDGVRIVQFNGAPAGQTVFHLHFHIIPTYEGLPTRPHATAGPLGADVLEPIAKKINAAL